jgi:hypothetical protein
VYQPRQTIKTGVCLGIGFIKCLSPSVHIVFSKLSRDSRKLNKSFSPLKTFIIYLTHTLAFLGLFRALHIDAEIQFTERRLAEQHIVEFNLRRV